MILIKTNYGPVKLQLDYEKTPETARNFEQYVKDGFYDGLIFHRVISNFMVQGGGFEPGMVPRKTREPVKNEADKADSNKTGTVAMARTMEPHSATAQFFINVRDNGFLDHSGKNTEGWGYTVFGKVVEGMDVVNTIKDVVTDTRAGHQDVPVKDVVIESASVIDDEAS